MEKSSPLPGVSTKILASLVLAIIFLLSQPLYGQGKKKANARVQRPPGYFDLQVASSYEQQGRWKEAEQEYLQAGHVGASCVKKEALAGLERLKSHRAADDQNFEFDLADYYLKERDWKKAEQHFAAAAAGGIASTRRRALEGIENARRQLRWEELKENVDRWLGYTARFLGFLALFVIVIRTLGSWWRIEILPFEISAEKADKTLAFALSSARESLPTVLGRIPAGLPLADNIPNIMLPGLEGGLEEAGNVEIGEVKLPLAAFFRWLKRPRVRVSGTWRLGFPSGMARARVLRRRFGFWYREIAPGAGLQIPSRPGSAQDRKLKRFACDVLVKAVFAHRR